ncbi:DUF1592 domain-containing protein [Stratiformator vulcanicus]|uniref:Planctomycete cytochrome C n=1 Tax=Stratiformator vulcanicus TaxID=2527980 RepID=A0A517QY39_9PLAN|nr:DUF1592 domain-containing protein [Stratiformator vulcanicus]QDT36586.1 Planctomycete cytochrome C [Stratiformator vulcanicus]
MLAKLLRESMRTSLILLLCLILGLTTPEFVDAAEPTFEGEVVPFLKQHCYQCHDAREAQAGLRIDSLGADFSVAKAPEMWREVIDRINIGDMPPEDHPRPDPAEAFAVVEWVGDRLRQAEREARSSGGRIVMRRLNREEYANTVGDLLSLDANFVAKIKEELPADGKAEGFDRLSSALFYDQTQLDSYLRVAEMIAEKAIQGQPPATQKLVWNAKKRPSKPTEAVYQGAKHKVPLGADYYKVRDGGFEVWNGVPYGKRGGDFKNIPPGPAPNLSNIVTEDGYYRIRVHGGSFAGERGDPIQLMLVYAANSPLQSVHYIDVKGSLREPAVAEKLVFLKAGQPGQKTAVSVKWNGLQNVRIRNPELAGLERSRKKLFNARRKAVLAKDKVASERLRKELDKVLEKLNTFSGPSYLHNEQYDLATVPRLFLSRIEFEGPVAEQWPPASHQALAITQSLPEREPDIRRMFARLLPVAYRRPVERGEVDRIVQLIVSARQDHGLSTIEALRMGLTAVFASPAFTYFHEVQLPPATNGLRSLDDFELASRLSYFLWSSMPDEELLRLAERKELSSPRILRRQVERMLGDPKARRFVIGFAGQWLSVDQFGSVMPANEYKSYDPELEAASIEEPLSFFEHVLNKDLPITHFLNSDFLVINERLATHYGIEGVTGEEFRPVRLRPDHHRGGVLGMAGLLTLLSDGTRTLPVRRAAWVRENLFNDPPPPPPPNAGEIQPNVKGNDLSVRERLAQHRNEPTCASCHAKLDPYGLALENYDAIGAWRTKQNGEGIRENRAPVIDPSGTLKSGRSFRDLEGYKAALLAERETFATAFAEKLLTYALCRPIGFADEKTVNKIVSETKLNDYRLHSVIQAIIASEPFQTK